MLYICAQYGQFAKIVRNIHVVSLVKDEGTKYCK